MRKIKKIVITGTHLTPAIEFIRQLKEDPLYKWEIIYIGREFNSSVDKQLSIESNLVPKLGVKFYGIKCGKFDRRWLFNTIRGFPDILIGFTETLKIFAKENPQFVVSFGGYVSVPVVYSAWLKRIKSISHEQTRTISLSTRINNLVSTKKAFSFKNDVKNSVITGNLLRREILTESRNFISSTKPVIYITAGNQGSIKINQLILDTYEYLKGYTLIHQTGIKDYKRIKKFSFKNKDYYVANYFNQDEVGRILHQSDLVISRGGANTCQEIDALSKRAIIIPLPVSSQDEQYKNAIWLKSRNKTRVAILKEREANPINLLATINDLMSKKFKIIKKKNKINYRLLKLLHEIV